jgi:hypothetical protein
VFKTSEKSEPTFFYYKGPEKSLFNWSWEIVYLRFSGDKLSVVSIYFKSDNDYHYNILLQDLENLFGRSLKANFYEMKKAGVLAYNEWEGANIKMNLRRISEGVDAPCDNCKILLEISSKKIEKQKLDSEF